MKRKTHIIATVAIVAASLLASCTPSSYWGVCGDVPGTSSSYFIGDNGAPDHHHHKKDKHKKHRKPPKPPKHHKHHDHDD